MGFGFLAPLFLAGLAAIAIPVLVHLTHRERREPVVFASLMFLHRIPFRTQRRQRLRHWLLFALRAAAVALLVAAFARPFVARSVAPGAAGRDVVLLLDRSASMGARGRWARAIEAARQALADLPSGARMAVVVFDDRAEVLADLTSDRVQLGAALDQARPGSGAGRFAPALQVAASIAERAAGAADVVLVSDFQRAAWEGAAVSRLPAGVALRTVDVGDTSLVNVALVGAMLERERGAQAATSVTARVASARGAAREVPVTMAVDGRTLQTVRVTVAPGGSALAHFAPIRDAETIRRATISIPADDQPADDAWHLVLGPAPRIGVLLVTRGDAPARDALYLRQALQVAGDPAFPAVMRAPGSVRAADLDAASVAIIHDAPFPAGDAGRRLLDWVRQGGGLLVALGARGTLPAELADSLGGGATVVDRGETGSAAGVEGTHPVFEGWASGAGLQGSRAFRYRRLERASTAPARWDDGAAALAEMRLGSGRVLVWTADFANRWSDLPLFPSFVPLLHGAVRHLAGYTPPPVSRLAGDVVELDEAPAATIVVERPSGEREALTAGAPARLLLGERGFYAVRQADERVAGMLLASNVPPVEADPARLVPEQLVAAVAPDASAPVSAVAGVANTSDRERGQRLWWYILAGVLLLFATESAVAHRMRGIV